MLFITIVTCSVTEHHKSSGALQHRNAILRWYYAIYPLFGYCCVGTECFYICLYVLHYYPNNILEQVRFLLLSIDLHNYKSNYRIFISNTLSLWEFLLSLTETWKSHFIMSSIFSMLLLWPIDFIRPSDVTKYLLCLSVQSYFTLLFHTVV